MAEIPVPEQRPGPSTLHNEPVWRPPDARLDLSKPLAEQDQGRRPSFVSEAAKMWDKNGVRVGNSAGSTPAGGWRE